MAKMRIYEIAKSLDMKSTDLVKKLQEQGFDVKSAQSNVEDDVIAFVLKNFSPKKKDAENKTEEKKIEENAQEKIQEKETLGKEKKVEEKIEKKEKEWKRDESQEEKVKEAFKKEQSEKKVEEKIDSEKNSSVEKNQTITQEKTKSEKKDSMIKKEEKVEQKQKVMEVKQEAMVQNKKEEQKQEEKEAQKEVLVEKRTEEKKEKQGNQRVQSNNMENNMAKQNNNGTKQNNINQNTNQNHRNQNQSNNRNNSQNNNNQAKNQTGNSQSGNQRQNNQQTQRQNNPQNQKQNRTTNSTEQNRNVVQKKNESMDRNQTTKSKEANSQNNTTTNHSDNNRNQFKAGKNKQNGNDNRGNNNQSNNNGYNNKRNKNKNKNNNEVNTPKKDPNRKGAFIMPKPAAVEKEAEDAVKVIVLPEVMTIKELADKMKLQASVIVKKLFMEGKMVSINSELTFEDAEELALEYDFIAEMEEKVDVIEELLKEEEEDDTVMSKRSPVVCVMGHVDHGKTSLLDAIRQTNVTEREAGGITQHIGAYVVNRNGESITFLDTPGHEAFTSMRMRGAKSTDIAILVVAADDGVMPQTIEAINHAKAAGVEIIVAINKIDKPSANIERVKQELVEYELIAEDWGGTTTFVPVSAHTKEGIDELLEMILLTAEILELKANPNRKARGIVIEAQLDKGKGPVATILVQKGTLCVGDAVAIGSAYGKVRAMMDDKGKRVKEAGPSKPVEILGLNEVPEAGEIVLSTDNDKEARSIAEAYIKQSREKLLDDTKAKLSLDGLFSQIQAGNIKELNLIIKADVQGSVEAVKQSLLKLSNEEVAIRVIHGGVGAINESDVSLAIASSAIIIGFNVRPDNTAKEIADREKVDLRLYRVIYNAIEDVEAAMKGMLDPVYEEKVVGHAEVRQVFKASGLGTIAGSYVLDGKIVRGSSVRIFREGVLIHEGALASLKRFKDDVKEVATGYECGLVFEKYNDIKEFDQVEAYIMEEVPR